jgi:hypothetical protein
VVRIDSGADQGVLADGDPAHDDRSGADGGALPDDGGHDFPVTDRLGIKVVGEDHVGADEDLVLDGDPSGYEREGLDLAPVADGDAPLDLDIGGDLAPRSDLAAVEVHEVTDHGALPDLAIIDGVIVGQQLHCGLINPFFGHKGLVKTAARRNWAAHDRERCSSNDRRTSSRGRSQGAIPPSTARMLG